MFAADEFVFSKYELLVNGNDRSADMVSLPDTARQFEIAGLSPNTDYAISLSTVSGPNVTEKSEPDSKSSYTR